MAAAFVGEQFFCASAEDAALLTLISVSSGADSGEGGGRTRRNERYWRTRIFAFLSATHDLISVPKD